MPDAAAALVPEHVLDLFATPAADRRLPGGRGRSVVAGDLVLSPDRDPVVAEWLSPVLARLAVSIDERPGRVPGGLRVAVPVPARDGSWVVDGWAAARWEPGTRGCDDLAVTLAAGRLLHAELASAVSAPPGPPESLARRTDRWARAERLALGPYDDVVAAAGDLGQEVRSLLAALRRWVPEPSLLGGDQLVHADLAGNVLLDVAGSPVVIDVSPAWGTPRWAEAVCTLDTVTWAGVDRAAASCAAQDVTREEREALARATAYRLLGDERPDAAAYASALESLGLA